MSRKNKKKTAVTNHKEIYHYEDRALTEGLSREELIQIHETAYYNALKKFEEEKITNNKVTSGDLVETGDKQACSDYIKHKLLVGFFALFFPWAITCKCMKQDLTYTSMISTVVSVILGLAGLLSWVIAMFFFFGGIFFWNGDSVWKCFVAWAVLIMIANLCIGARSDFAKEQNNELIISFASCIFSLAAVVIAISPLILKLLKNL